MSSGTIDQYVDRTVDVSAFDTSTTTPKGELLNQTLVSHGNTGSLVTGILKLSQRFLLELMTDMGSLKYKPTRGTLFMLQARAGYWRTVADVEQSFYSALIDIENNLITEEQVDDPADEKYGSAELLLVTLLSDQVILRINVKSLAGDSRDVVQPLRINNFN